MQTLSLDLTQQVEKIEQIIPEFIKKLSEIIDELKNFKGDYATQIKINKIVTDFKQHVKIIKKTIKIFTNLESESYESLSLRKILTIKAPHATKSYDCFKDDKLQTEIGDIRQEMDSLTQKPSTCATEQALHSQGLLLQEKLTKIIKYGAHETAKEIKDEMYAATPLVAFSYLRAITPAITYLSKATLLDRRFTNIDCPAHTCLQPINSIHLHANTVQLNHRVFIAAQAPLGFKEAFWQMIDTNSVSQITDLAATQEFSSESPMYPSKEMPLDYLTLKISFKNENPITKSISVFTFKIDNKLTKTSKDVNLIKFEDWADHGCSALTSIDTILELIARDDGLQIVRCKAGVGRTGTLIVADALKHAFESGELRGDNWAAKIEEFVLKGREQRGKDFVQSPKQLEMLINFCEHLLSKSTK